VNNITKHFIQKDILTSSKDKNLQFLDPKVIIKIHFFIVTIKFLKKLTLFITKFQITNMITKIDLSIFSFKYLKFKFLLEFYLIFYNESQNLQYYKIL